jgi:hypothetical protein
VKPSDRRDVLWIGKTPPPALLAALDEHELRSCAVSESGSVLAAPTARALILEFDGDIASFVAVVRRSVNTLVDHGLLIALCHRNSTKREADLLQHVDQAILKTAEKKRYMVLVGQRWNNLAYQIVKHNPGPGAATSVEINNEITDPAVKLFVQRAFWDFRTVRCEMLAMQGLSGATVMLVHPSRAGGPSDCFLPKLMKVGPVDDIENERLRFHEYVRHTVPFNYRPNMDWERSLVGLEQAAIVQDFVEPAFPFSDAVESGGASVLAASLFDGALGNWRSSAIEKTDGVLSTSIARRIESGLSNKDSNLQAAFIKARLDTVKWPDPSKLAKVPYRFCRIHGDLHAGNVFVGTTSGDCILIDFAKSEDSASAIDPAALEVQLALSGKTSTKMLNELYRWPVQLPTLTRAWLPNAVRAIRMFGLAGEADDRAYGLAVIDQLLRFAKFPQPKLAVRARAARLAFRMLTRACA